MRNSKIESIKAREIIDSRGNPTVEATLKTDLGVFYSSVPSGASTGKYEAMELRDEDGKGVSKAIKNIEKVIAPALENKDLTGQKDVDEILLGLDATKNKSHLGANAILPVSIAVCRALAASKKLPLYRYIREIGNWKLEIENWPIPKPSFNMIEGGKHAPKQNPEGKQASNGAGKFATGHAESGLAFQEFMIIPQKEIFKENLEIGIKIYQKLREILEEKFGKENINPVKSRETGILPKSELFNGVKLSTEGAFAAPIKKITEAFDLILEAAEKTGYQNDIKLATDVAATSFFENGKYKINDEFFDEEKLMNFYQGLVNSYPIISIEDPFQEEDFTHFAALFKKIGEKVIILGDDLLVSNSERIKIAEERKAVNGLILKPNQIGTVTETLESARLAKSFGWKIMVSNRAGETEDDFIADLAVGIGAEFIKSGAPFAKERMAKYNRLVRIEEEIRSAS